jgi:hypothetical protein
MTAAANLVNPHPAPIHIDPPGAMRQHVGGYGALQWLAGHGDRLQGGL